MPAPSYAGLRCPHPLRRHQGEALDAIERARAGGSTRWWVTMPPGAGKTLVGTEVARRLGRRTVVLCPNTAIQGQWVRTWDSYDGPRAGTNRDLRTVFTALTYQSLAVFDGEAEVDGSHVERLHENGLALIETLRSAGPLTVILDECHHLLEVWGELLREVLDELPEAMVLGLTATPPGSLTRSQEELTGSLFGPILYEARIPALVKEGTLAPYAEMAWLVEPTPAEAEWLSEQANRFAELTADLFDPEFGSTSLAEWLTQRLVRPCEDGSSTWDEICARDPDLGDAALRLVHAELLALPSGAVLREQHRRSPTADDWRALLDDWLLQCVQPRSLVEGEESAADKRVLENLRRTLPAIGYVWTKNGIRTGRGDVDRVTARSAAKQDAVTGIVTAELSNLGDRARVLVLCDHEQATATTRHRLSDDETMPPEPAGSATGVLAALLADPATSTLDPLLVTGRTVAGDVETLRRLIDWVDRTHPGMAASLVVDARGEVPTLSGRWNSGQWVAHVTGFFAAGGTRALVGTRGLLGEGWDAPAITTLIDLTTATTPTAVTQTRGRALRIDPADSEKVALIWSVVAVFEGHVAGANDWWRFARKHVGYFTIDELGGVVDGVAGVDSAFSGFQPPAVTEFAPIDARMLVRAQDRALVRRRWLETPGYLDRVDHVARIRRDPGATTAGLEPGSTTGTAGLVPWTEASRRHPGGRLGVIPPAIVLTLVATLVALGHTAGWLLLLVPALVLGAALWGRSSVVAASRRQVTIGLVAAAVADGLHAADLAPAGAEALHVETTPDGVASFSLAGVPDEVSSRFALALDEAVASMSAPRYVLPRWVTAEPQGLDGLLRGLRAVVRHRPEDEVWHTVPSVLADSRAHADAYAAAWNHWVGGGPAVYAASPEGAGVLATHRGLDPFAVTCVIRRTWH